MALKQTRRTISFNRTVYETIMKAAHEAGMTASHYVEECMRAKLELPVTKHMTPEGKPLFETARQRRANQPKRRPGRPRLTLQQRVERLKQSWGIA